MRRLFLAALGVFAVAGVASAQQPQYQPARDPGQQPVPDVPAGRGGRDPDSADLRGHRD